MPDDVAGAPGDSPRDGADATQAEIASRENEGIRIGCADLPSGQRRSRYFDKLSYLEVGGTMFQLPKNSVLKRWRDDTGQGGGFGLLAPQLITHKPGRKGYPRSKVELSPAQLAQAGGFQASELVNESVQSLARATTTVEAEVVLFRSPADFSPSASNRLAMTRFFAEVATPELFGATVRVWEPQGLWEPDVAARLAADMGVLYACDPLSNDPIGPGGPDDLDPDFFAHLPQDSAYFRLTGLGRARQRFDEYAMAELLELTAAYQRTWIVFAHLDKYPDAIQLTRHLNPPKEE